MNRVEYFFEPQYHQHPQGFGERTWNVIEGYFDHFKDATPLKIISYATLIFPLIMLVAKWIIRCTMPKPVANSTRVPPGHKEPDAPKRGDRRERTIRWPGEKNRHPPSPQSVGSRFIGSRGCSLMSRHLEDMDALNKLDAKSKIPEEVLQPLIKVYPLLNQYGISLVEAGQRVEQYVKEKGDAANFTDFIRSLRPDREIDERLQVLKAR